MQYIKWKKPQKLLVICKADIKTNEGNKWKVEAFQIWHKKTMGFIYRTIIFRISFYWSHLAMVFEDFYKNLNAMLNHTIVLVWVVWMYEALFPKTYIELNIYFFK